MTNIKYNLSFALFVATIACASYIFGWLSSEWVNSIEAEETTSKDIKLSELLVKEGEYRLLNSYGHFRKSVEMLESFIAQKENPRDPEATERLVKLYKSEVESLLPWMKEAISIVNDTDMRDKLSASIRKAETMVNKNGS